MAPKKKALPVENVRKKGEKVKLSDFMCPICLCILIEPVNLPCKHELCKICFEESVEKVTLCCPVCRQRVSSWYRKAANENSLVNVERWKFIQRHFPQQVRNKIQGLNNDVIDEDEFPSIHQPKISSPGSIRKEYEQQLREHEKILQKQREEESKASEKLISKIFKEEQKHAKIREQNDAIIAKKLSTNLNQGNLLDETSEVDAFLSIKAGEICGPSELDGGGSVDSQDSISHEVNTHFRPIRTAPKTPPKKYNGSSNCLRRVDATPGNKENSSNNLNFNFMTSTPSTARGATNFSIFTPIKPPKTSGGDNLNEILSPVRAQLKSDFSLAKKLQDQYDHENRTWNKPEKRKYWLRRKRRNVGNE